MLGKAEMNPDFRPLADFIDSEFGVKVINIIYDTIEKSTRPRLNIIFEFARERTKFIDEAGNFDEKKQKIIADEFRESQDGIAPLQNWFNSLFRRNPRHRTSNLVVVFSAFETVAKIDAFNSISSDELKSLQEELNNDDIWSIPGVGNLVLFLHTTKQVLKYRGSDIHKQWTDSYFKLIKRYDRFGYFKREFFSLELDSKENLDKNYEGSLYYYFK